MNQTKKRLSIINLAISITDIETIQLQILKLGLLKTDEKIQHIISMLQAENYAQAQGLITTYIETPTENVLQRSSQEKKHIITKEEQSTIDEFQLFVTPDENEEKVTIDINDYMSDDLHTPTAKPMSKEKKRESIEKIEEIDINDFLSVAPVTPTKQPETNAFDSLLNIDVNDVLTDNIDLNISYAEDDNFFALPRQEKKANNPTSDIPKDTFFDLHDEEISESKVESIDDLNNTLMQNTTVEKTEIKTEEVAAEETLVFTQDEPLQKDLLQEDDRLQENILQEKTSPEENLPKDLTPSVTSHEKTAPTHYKSIPYIAQKLESMNTQYPSSYSSHEPFSALSELLTKISQEKFTEDEIEETLIHVRKLNEDQQFSQAAQLLLVCAATPSPFAQLILARELYKGVVLTQNIPQAFILLNALSMDDYPEALCDLGQFYENGIGTKKDKKRAQELYKDAMDLGIRRAGTHHARMQKSRKGFFGS